MICIKFPNQNSYWLICKYYFSHSKALFDNKKKVIVYMGKENSLGLNSKNQFKTFDSYSLLGCRTEPKYARNFERGQNY